MNQKNLQIIQDATLTLVTAQVERMLVVARIKGWVLPAKYAIGLTVIAATALVTKVKVRMDGVVQESVISSVQVHDDVVKLVDALTQQWLPKHATEPAKKRRARAATA